MRPPGTRRRPARPRRRPPGPGTSRRCRRYQAIGAASLAREAAGWVTGAGTGVEASTLLHGAVLGVPLPGVTIARDAFTPDLRPDPATVGIVAGDHVDDLVVAGLSGVLGGTGDARRSVERLLTAFAAGLLPSLSSPDGLVTIDEREHEAGFAGVAAGEPPVTDRVLTSRAPLPPRGTPPQAAPAAGTATATLTYSGPGVRMSGFLTEETADFTRARLAQVTVPDASGQAAAARAGTSAAPAPGQPAGSGQAGSGAAPAPGTGSGPPDSATVQRQPPGRFTPLDPQIGLRGAGLSPRHGGDGRGDPDELLGCRRGSQIAQRYTGLLDGAALVPALSSGALPDETTALVREALLLSPTLLTWLAARATPAGAPAPRQAAGAGAVPAGAAPPAAPLARLGAELVLRFDPAGGYLGKAAPGLTIGRGDLDPVGASTLELLRRHSLLDGVEPDLVALTSWAQPWVPAWLEWELAVTPAADLSGWQLGPVDYEPAGNRPGRPRPGRRCAGTCAGHRVRPGSPHHGARHQAGRGGGHLADRRAGQGSGQRRRGRRHHRRADRRPRRGRRRARPAVGDLRRGADGAPRPAADGAFGPAGGRHRPAARPYRAAGPADRRHGHADPAARGRRLRPAARPRPGGHDRTRAGDHARGAGDHAADATDHRAGPLPGLRLAAPRLPTRRRRPTGWSTR